MAFCRARMGEHLARRLEQERLVIGVAHEPAQLAGKILDHHEVLLHAADERFRRHAGVTRKRSVGDEIGTLEALGQRRPARGGGTGAEQGADGDTSREVTGCLGHKFLLTPPHFA